MAHYIPTTYTTICGAEVAAVPGHDGQTVTFVGLTPCCKASGKGDADSSTGVVCRSCYNEVHSLYGTSGWLSARRAVRDAKCKDGDNCTDHALWTLDQMTTPVRS